MSEDCRRTSANSTMDPEERKLRLHEKRVEKRRGWTGSGRHDSVLAS
jgi:hypothetical protein